MGLYPNDASWLDSAGRLLIVAFFVIVGLRNLQKHHVEDHIKRLGFFKTPYPAAAFWLGIALEFVGCAMILVNWRPAIGVLCLIVFTVVASLLLLRFWEMDDPMKRMGMQNGFLANLAVLGGLLLLLQNVR
jgi:uncharacterized membrane protein YphA (DoxX/SURF4 family)